MLIAIFLFIIISRFQSLENIFKCFKYVWLLFFVYLSFFIAIIKSFSIHCLTACLCMVVIYNIRDFLKTRSFLQHIHFTFRCKMKRCRIILSFTLSFLCDSTYPLAKAICNSRVKTYSSGNKKTRRDCKFSSNPNDDDMDIFVFF